MTSPVDLQDWVGREQSQDDRIGATPLTALAATLDHDVAAPKAGDALPPLWHWLFFLPHPLAREIGADGHPTLGGFLPPVGLPRRMWAGSRLAFEHAPLVGEAVRRTSRIESVKEKNGASGRLVFVTVHHEIHTPRGLAIREAHDIVYREMPTAAGATVAKVATAARGTRPEATPEAQFGRTITPDPVLLFRYSALTFNSHRIHYDLPYVTQVEGYPGLIVHGPLIATLLLDLLRREIPDATVGRFRFEARRPLFDNAPFSVHGRTDDGQTFALWALTPQGEIAMQATAAIA